MKLNMFVLAIFFATALIYGDLQATQAQAPTDPYRMAVWSPDGMLLAISIGKDTIEIDDITQNTIARFDLGLGDVIVQPVWSPSSEALAFDVGRPGIDRRLVIWYFATDTRLEIGEDVPFGTPPDTPTWSVDSAHVAVARLNSLFILDATTGKVVHQATFGNPDQRRGITNIAWSPDGKLLLIEDRTGKITILDGQTYNLITSFGGKGLNDSFLDILWSSDSHYFVGYSTENIQIFNFTTGDIIKTLPLPTSVLQWTNDTMVILSTQNSIKLVDTENWQTVSMVMFDVGEDRLNSVSWNPQQNLFAYTIRSATFKPLPPDKPGVHVIVAPPVPGILREQMMRCIMDTELLTALNASIDTMSWEAFIRQVEAQRGKQIDQTCADQLIEMAQALEATLAL